MESVNNSDKEKHAYLIIAHNKFEQLNFLLNMLDHEKHDFFVHIDKKVNDFDKQQIIRGVRYSNIFFTKRIKVTWGGFSQIKSELLLLKEAIKIGCYEYYHLLSGVDLPIKNCETIYDFFHKNAEKNFVTCDFDFVPLERIKYYYLFQERIGRKNCFLRKMQGRFLSVQKLLRINRLKNKNINWGKGGNWFSINDKLAKYVIEKENWIKKFFKHTRCADEMFLQTILLNSEFKKTLYLSSDGKTRNMRYIDWTRSVNYGPHTFTSQDYENIIASDCMFARKFDIDKDREIIEKIYSKIKK